MQSPWWHSAVVYQIYPRSFQDSDGDGAGDLRGILSRLDHLEALGVDAVWLSPVYPSPMDDNGYDISDYQDVDPRFGTLADLDELIAALHARGMRLLMDLVVNHTSDEHPWFEASRSSRDDPRRDWYWWRPARPGHEPGTPGAEPNNWGSFFSGPAWEYDAGTGEYYLHLFSRKQPDLNWENPEVRAAVATMMRWWLDRGVDGFRMDVVNLVSKDPALPDAPVREGEAHGVIGRSVVDGPRVHEFLAELRREVAPDRDDVLLVGEMPGVTIEEGLRYTDPARGEVDMLFHFDHMRIDRGPSKWDRRPFDLDALRRSLAAWQHGLGDVGWNALYWDNHDQPRVVSRYGDDGEHREQSAKTLATVLHLQRGTPYVFQGDELGMTNYPFTAIAELDDIESRNWYAEQAGLGRPAGELMAALRATSRDNARTPMQWDASKHAGFTTGEPWLPVHPDAERVNAARQVGVVTSVFEHYRALIKLRHEEPAVVYGDFDLLLPDHPQLFCFRRRWRSTELLVVASFAAEPLELPDELDLSGDVVIGTAGDRRLAAWESRVYRRRSQR